MCLVDKDSARYTSTKGNAQHLTDSHEADAVGNISGADLHLRDGEASLAIAADTDSKKDGVAVDSGIAGIFIGRVCIRLVSELGYQSNAAARAGKLCLQSRAPPMTCSAQPKRYHG